MADYRRFHPAAPMAIGEGDCVGVGRQSGDLPPGASLTPLIGIGRHAPGAVYPNGAVIPGEAGDGQIFQQGGQGRRFCQGQSLLLADIQDNIKDRIVFTGLDQENIVIVVYTTRPVGLAYCDGMVLKTLRVLHL